MIEKCVNYSLSEIDAECKKAARGSGFSWGHAEEVGKAIRWLTAYELDGPAILAEYLTKRENNISQYQSHAIDKQEVHPAEGGNFLCPLMLGSHICDNGINIFQDKLELNNLAYPLLLLPYIARIAREFKVALSVQWNGVVFNCHEDKLLFVVHDDFNAPLAGKVICEKVSLSNKGELPGRKGQCVPENAWQGLNQFSYRIYVPSSEASRKGAGPS